MLAPYIQRLLVNMLWWTSYHGLKYLSQLEKGNNLVSSVAPNHHHPFRSNVIVKKTKTNIRYVAVSNYHVASTCVTPFEFFIRIIIVKRSGPFFQSICSAAFTARIKMIRRYTDPTDARTSLQDVQNKPDAVVSARVVGTAGQARSRFIYFCYLFITIIIYIFFFFRKAYTSGRSPKAH